jgi:hypothetical protein
MNVIPNSTEERVALVERIAWIIQNWRDGNAGEDDASDTARWILRQVPTRTDNDVSGLVEALEEIAAPVVRPPRTQDEAFKQREALRDIAADALAKHRQSNGGEA